MTNQDNKQLTLINATQHSQVSPPWSDLGVTFLDPAFCPYGPFLPKHGTREQVVAAWRNLLDRFDNALYNGEDVDGFLLGGYPPAVLGLYQFLSQFRQRCYVAVMGPAPIVEGQRRAFVLQGLRSIPTPRALKSSVVSEGQPLPSEHPDIPTAETFVIPKIQPHQIDHSRLVYVSARPFSEARAEEIRNVSGVQIVASAPALPPPAGHSLADFEAAIEDIARLACELRCGILLDGPPAETLLRVYALLGHMLPFWFTKTEVVAPPPAPAQLVAIEKIPRF